MNHNKMMRMAQTGLLTALVCAATMVIRIPTPNGGYVNIGDALVLLSGWMLGPVYGFFAAGVGSALADLLWGYGAYVPGTLIIKGTARKGMYRLFFLLEDGRKIIAPVFRWQRYLNFFDVPIGTELVLTFADGRDGKTYLKKMEPVA